MDEWDAEWVELCGEAQREEDAVKFLDVTMKIIRFLGRKRQHLDAKYEEAERRELASQIDGSFEGGA
jgi:hypothetical protein